MTNRDPVSASETKLSISDQTRAALAISDEAQRQRELAKMLHWLKDHGTSSELAEFLSSIPSDSSGVYYNILSRGYVALTKLDCAGAFNLAYSMGGDHHEHLDTIADRWSHDYWKGPTSLNDYKRGLQILTDPKFDPKIVEESVYSVMEKLEQHPYTYDLVASYAGGPYFNKMVRIVSRGMSSWFPDKAWTLIRQMTDPGLQLEAAQDYGEGVFSMSLRIKNGVKVAELRDLLEPVPEGPLRDAALVGAIKRQASLAPEEAFALLEGMVNQKVFDAALPVALPELLKQNHRLRAIELARKMKDPDLRAKAAKLLGVPLTSL